MNERLKIQLSYEDACRISGVSEERGYVTLQEVVDAINEEFGLDLKGSDQVGWLKDRISDQNSSNHDSENVC